MPHPKRIGEAAVRSGGLSVEAISLAAEQYRNRKTQKIGILKNRRMYRIHFTHQDKFNYENRTASLKGDVSTNLT
jgi:hypothetical protein